MTTVSKLIRMVLQESSLEEDAGPETFPVTDRRVIETFLSDPENPFLVSFPRTGSHWLRMMMEQYFERPSLTRVFYYPARTDYLTLHTHDLDLDVTRRSVIYLYRDPIDTVYSQLRYHGQEPEDRARVREWSDLYGRHLAKWLYDEAAAEIRTVLRYEDLRDQLQEAFARLCAHFGQTLDPDRLRRIGEGVTRSHVSQKTRHDPAVINTSGDYGDLRRRFRERHGDFVRDVVVRHDSRLESCLLEAG